MKLSHPLTKAFQTTEGVLVIVMDVVSAVTTVLDPSVLPHKIAAGVIVAQHVALLAQRGYIKGRAVANLVGLPVPKAPLSNTHVMTIKGDATAAVKAIQDAVENLSHAPESATTPDPEVAAKEAAALASAVNVDSVPVAAPTPVPAGQPTTPAV